MSLSLLFQCESGDFLPTDIARFGLCCSLSGFGLAYVCICLAEGNPPAGWLLLAPIPLTHALLLPTGSGLIARDGNKPKRTHSVINAHTLPAPLPPPRRKAGPGCGSEDGVRWMWADSPATPPSSRELCSRQGR